ncbi:MAG: AlwI family type II restriction endonuclease, partial [archaeon]
NEGQPVMRHLRDFEDKSSQQENFALFIAPSLHRDTLNTFWFSCKYEYEGTKQKIVPIRIKDLIVILETIIRYKEEGIKFTNKELRKLLNNISSLVFEIDSADEWQNAIYREIKKFKNII